MDFEAVRSELTLALVGVYMMWVGRMIYTAGYIEPGRGGIRTLGFCVFFLQLIMLFICAFWTAAKVMEFGADLYEIEDRTILKPIRDLIK